MTATTTTRARVGRGVPRGGEFTAQQRSEATITLDPSAMAAERGRAVPVTDRAVSSALRAVPVAPATDRERFGANSADIRDTLRAHFPDLTLHLGGSTPFLVLDMIAVPKPLRGQGLARAAMEQLVAAADAAGRPMALTPDSSLGSSKARLVAFYRSFGFVPNSGRNKDFGIMESMIRQPTVHQN